MKLNTNKKSLQEFAKTFDFENISVFDEILKSFEGEKVRYTILIDNKTFKVHFIITSKDIEAKEINDLLGIDAYDKFCVDESVVDTFYYFILKMIKFNYFELDENDMNILKDN